jgi:hypothetical protein
MAGDAPKPVSLELDGPIAQEASGKTVKTARRFNKRMWVLSDECWLMMFGKNSKKPGLRHCLLRRKLLHGFDRKTSAPRLPGLVGRYLGGDTKGQWKASILTAPAEHQVPLR